MLVSQKSAKFLGEIEKDLFSDGMQSLRRSFLFGVKVQNETYVKNFCSKVRKQYIVTSSFRNFFSHIENETAKVALGCSIHSLLVI